MAPQNARFQQHMHDALDNELTDAEYEALQEQIAASADTAAEWESLRKTDQVLRETPPVSPSPQFAARVMAAIAALPAHTRRHLGTGLALGLTVVAFMTVPLVAVLLATLVLTITDPGTLTAVLQGAIDATSYLVGLGRDVMAELEAFVTDPAALPFLATVVIILVLGWGAVIWNLVGRRTLPSRR